jgi:hypothetical protein
MHHLRRIISKFTGSVLYESPCISSVLDGYFLLFAMLVSSDFFLVAFYVLVFPGN